MNQKYNLLLGIVLASVGVPQLAGANEREPFIEGHGDLAFDYTDGDWRVTLRDGSPVDTYTVILGPNAELAVPPNNADFAFLGEAGDSVWVIPQVSAPGIPFLGFVAEDTPQGVFMSDRFDIFVTEVSGPGSFYIWSTDGGGRPSVSVDSGDGLDDSDVLSMPAAGHFHENLGFTSPGTYEMGWQASGTLLDGTVVESEVEYTRVEVAVAKEGELDLEVLYEGGEWELALLDEATETEFELNQIALHAGPNTWTRNTDNEAFAFLGEPGRPLMVLPQDEQEGVLYLGIAGDEIDAGVFEDDTVVLGLHAVDGPGDVFLYEVDPLGASVVHWNSADGLSGSDHYEVAAGSHAHANWAFTAPGIYRLTLEASGVLASTGAAVASEEATVLVEVFAPEFLEEGHADIGFAFVDGEWEIAVHADDDHHHHEEDDDHGDDHGDDDDHDDDHHHEGGELCLADVVFQGTPASQVVVPEGGAFAFLGAAGSMVSVLPQDETEDVLFLGLAGEEQETGVFENDVASLTLLDVQGPGAFSLYQVDAFGVPSVFFNSADGISETDVFLVAAGSHAHANWGFSVPGIYTVTVQASGVLVDSGDTTVSDPVTLVFDILEDDHSEPEFEEGELDLEVVYQDGEWELAFLDEATDTEFPLDAVTLEAVPATWTRNTDDPAFAFLGEAGRPLFILPQDEQEGVLYLGIAGDEIDLGVFEGDAVNLSLTAVDGPGEAFLYQVDALGSPTVFWNSADGLSAGDQYPVAVGSHAHVNWAFTAPGDYLLSVQASGVLASTGAVTSSEEMTMLIEVISPEFAYEGHADVAVGFEEGELLVAAHVDDDHGHDDDDHGHDDDDHGHDDDDHGHDDDDHGHDDDDDHGHDDHGHGAIVFRATPEAVTTVPEGDAYAFLGAPGAVISVLPQQLIEEVLFLGLAGDELAEGVLENDSANLHLVDVAGPGAFSLYQVDSFGTPTVYFDTADGITESDVYSVAAGSHAHANWGFTAPGVYRVTLQASGVLVGGEAIMSEPETFVFDVLPGEPAPPSIAAGELDLEVVYDDGEFELVFLDESTETEFSVDMLSLEALPATWTRNTEDPAFAFLGEAGRPLFILPQDEQEGVLYLGIAGDEIDLGVFEGDAVNLSLTAVDGPGSVFLYQVDSFGSPTAFWNSGDGLSFDDQYPVAAGSHAHANWAFTESGTYLLSVQASGTLTSTGATVSSDVATVMIEVISPEFFYEGELDIEIAFEDAEWEIAAHVHDDEHGHDDDDPGHDDDDLGHDDDDLGHDDDDDHGHDDELHLDEIVLRAVPQALALVPENTAFGFLGIPGSVVSVLPQDETEGVLFLGIAGEDLGTGVFENDSVDLHLLDLEGPGAFSLYQVDAFGAPTVFFNTADDITESDVYPVAVGSHAHANWGFTVPGVYRATVQASGVLVESGETSMSEPVTLVFDILPPEPMEGDDLRATLVDASTLELTFDTTAGLSYRVQIRDSLSAGGWTSVGIAIPGTGAPVSITFPIEPSSASRFYQIVEE